MFDLLNTQFSAVANASAKAMGVFSKTVAKLESQNAKLRQIQNDIDEKRANLEDTEARVTTQLTANEKFIAKVNEFLN